jgi:riboflavin biosynthesis pyrimidine reductase
VRLLTDGREVDDLLDPYRGVDRSAPIGPCWVMANMVGGLDGSAAIAGRVGALSDDTDARLFREMRSLADVILVGAETVRRERYGAAAPRIAVVTRSLRLDWSLELFTSGRGLVITCESAPPDRVAEARGHAEVLVVGDASVDLRAAVVALAERGARVVLCEGGPTLLGELVALDLLDELCLTIAPVMGGDPLPIAVSPHPGDLTRFELAHVGRHAHTLFLRYRRVAPA